MCTGISWKGREDGAGVNHTELNPPSATRTYSSIRRDSSQLDQVPGWIPSSNLKGEWMQIDLGEDRELSGVVTQARGNNCCGPMGVTSFTVQYSSDGVNFEAVPGVLPGPSEAYLTNDWAASLHDKFQVFFPSVITARYIRIVVETWVNTPVLRAEVLLHKTTDVFHGKHVFRRCLESDRYTRLVQVGSLTEGESRDFTVPNQFQKSVACPGCYQCREVPLAPNYGSGAAFKAYWGPYLQSWATQGNRGFNVAVEHPGTENAMLTVSLPEPVKWNDYRLSWEHHNPEFICRVDPAASMALEEPDLDDDDEWTTFLLPTRAETDPGGSLDDWVIDAIAAGFQPPEAVASFESRDTANLAAVYPPGQQVDPSVTSVGEPCSCIPCGSSDPFNYGSGSCGAASDTCSAAPPVELQGDNDNSASNLQACIGECDSDAQCASGLSCFQRSNGEAIPGCLDTGGNDADWDYCYDPALSGGGCYSDCTSGHACDCETLTCADGVDDDFLTPRWWLQPEDSCANCNCEVFDVTCPTSSPTVSPTMVPSVSSTASPTGSPSVTPTSSPTVSPTDLPVQVPTVDPTATFVAPSVAVVTVTFSGITEEQFYSSGLDEVLVNFLARELGVDASNVVIVLVEIEGGRRLGQQQQQLSSRGLKAAGDLIVTMEITAAVATSRGAGLFTEEVEGLLNNQDTPAAEVGTFVQDNIPGASLGGLTVEVKDPESNNDDADGTPFGLGFSVEVFWGGIALGVGCLALGAVVAVRRRRQRQGLPTRPRTKSAFSMFNPMAGSSPKSESNSADASGAGHSYVPRAEL
jgi:hypothetical protein